MVTTEVSTAVSGMEPMPPPPESDGSIDFFDNDKLKETFSSGGLDFDDWTLLISEIENSFPDDTEKLCLVYDAFLLEFPLCHGYWRKYAYHKIQLCTLDDAVEVFERAIQAATYSVSVWLDYCTFGVAAYEDPHDVCRLFERGLSFVGKDYSCCTLWDKYIEFLLGQKQWSSLAHVYLRTLRYPSKKLHFYYKNFRKIAASLKEKIKCRIDVNGDLSSDPMEADLVPTRHTDEEISVVIRDLMGPSSSLVVAKPLLAYLSIGEQFYQDSQQLMEKISCFETQIRRPYFHVHPLDTNQLDNWHAYLSFAETYGDFDWAIKLYERCLIPCANYTEFWFRYVDFVESNGGRELANFALARASQTFVKNASAIHLFNARFKEHVGDASAASVALSRCGEELGFGFGFVENVTKKANMEKRLGNFEAADTTYREALKKTLIGKENLETTALLYVQFSRLKYMITSSADEAAQILIEGNEKVPHCKLLLEELIRLMMMHGGSRQVDLLDTIIDKEISHPADSSGGLSAEDKEKISNLYMEFIDLSGTIHNVRKALCRHIKLFPHSAKAKLHESCPSGNSLRELIQRREKTRECLNQDLSTNKGIGSTVGSPLEENKPLNSQGAQSKDAVRPDYINTEPNVGSLASGLHVEGKDIVEEREDLCESQSDLCMGLKADEGGERSREVSLPIQATPKPGFVTKQAHFSSSSVDTVKSDAIEIQPSGLRSPQSYQSQEFLRQTSRNRYQRRDLNQNHRDSKPRSQERSPQMSYSPVETGRGTSSQQMAVAPRDNRAMLQSSISQNQKNQAEYSASQLHPMIQTSNAYPQNQFHGQHMSVAPSDNPATLQSTISQIPPNQYHGSAAQVQTSFAYPQTQIPQNPVQSNDQQEGQMQSNEAYNQMWQQYYYYNYYYHQQQQQQLLSEQPQPNQNSQPQLDPNLLHLLSKQYQTHVGTQYSQPQQGGQLNTQQQSQEPQNQQQIQFQQQQQQEWFQQQQHWQQQQQQQYHLYLQQQQLQGEAKGDEQRPAMLQVSTRDSDIQKSPESEGNEVDQSSDTSITSI